MTYRYYHRISTTEVQIMASGKRLSFTKIFLIFIIIQPILDILTFVSKIHFEMNITIGIVVRVIFMLASLLYIFFSNEKTIKYKVILYIIILFSFLGIAFLINFLTKPNFYFFAEVQYLVKTLYFPVMFCTLFLLVESNKQDKKFYDLLYSAVLLAMIILSLSMFTAVLTNTSNSTYTYTKSGFTGWFYAGNEISAIVAIAFPIVFIYSLKRTNDWKDSIHWVPTLLLAITALMIGTKVSFFSVLGTIIVALLVNILNIFINIKKKLNYRIFVLNSLILVLYLLITPITPSYENVMADYVNLNKAVVENHTDPKREILEKNKESVDRVDREENKIEEKNPLMQSKIAKVILSSRNIYFEKVSSDYKNANIIHKIFGLGYAGFYDGEPKLVEMDFFDLFFSYGILGFSILMLPLVIVFWQLLKTIGKRFTHFIHTENILLCISLGLGLGVAFLAGHVLFAPAVSIYLSITLILLYGFNKDVLMRSTENNN